MSFLNDIKKIVDQHENSSAWDALLAVATDSKVQNDVIKGVIGTFEDIVEKGGNLIDHAQFVKDKDLCFKSYSKDEPAEKVVSGEHVNMDEQACPYSNSQAENKPEEHVDTPLEDHQ